jgi:probable rRNA maturation factor
MVEEPDLAIHIICQSWRQSLPEVEDICRRAALAALRLASKPVEAGIVLADDDFLRRLNKDYRGRDEATNVLAFGGLDGPAEGPTLMGDVMVAHGRARAECENDPSIGGLADHLSHLVVHGMLHLLGHDHEHPADARAMESLEAEILAGLGISDPYGAETGSQAIGVEQRASRVKELLD